ncbi:MAG: IPT/TIG domain-containing protein [Acidobacteriia bacterium]|nr:IPT/TIG domain-containing protein [Terriglobia bacterium]
MRIYPLLLAPLLALAAPGHLLAQSTLPQMERVEPASGKSGDVLTVAGANLDQNTVAALYLTDGTSDVKVEITAQTATEIKFKIPATVKSGRLALMVLTKGNPPKLIEEPVKVVVEAPGSTPTS